MHKELLEWMSHHERPLPWRDPATSRWGILVCEVMSQQTPVSRVAQPWAEWMERWPTPADLADARPADVIRAWGSLGYPRRALRLRDCAQALASQHGGQVPDTEDELLKLPGIGPYTAAAVLAFGCGKRALVLDTNIRRVLARLSGEALPRPSLTHAERQRAEAFLPSDTETSVAYNAAIMELGALVCTAKNPSCDRCPLAGRCQWRQAGYPADEHVNKRKTQSWEGTLRQARGRVLKALRDHDGPRPRTDFDDIPRSEEAIESLLTDELIAGDADRIGLPGSLDL